ncbi:hypothetical protein KMW28_26220 [Flammeovirga yaeyamensis]|uniref:Lipoprotein n=1 Tax=Flammeovirga yaeyamensis TaxID=367791 RepID=A0AAX1NA17_9BACT|nr:hypothetical protein [Flammeovirga yaeyamensis]MBB3699201.1 hypothetical protein [Flammeovirga yaeyamensis]NMF35535.1 hypothetical protein [Flammeovirga yaeyamensis]QWG04394.1 hypothetical protein KMW28_26220 [Flammeovirga yaeyamensis]
MNKTFKSILLLGILLVSSCQKDLLDELSWIEGNIVDTMTYYDEKVSENGDKKGTLLIYYLLEDNTFQSEKLTYVKVYNQGIPTTDIVTKIRSKGTYEFEGDQTYFYFELDLVYRMERNRVNGEMELDYFSEHKVDCVTKSNYNQQSNINESEVRNSIMEKDHRYKSFNENTNLTNHSYSDEHIIKKTNIWYTFQPNGSFNVTNVDLIVEKNFSNEISMIRKSSNEEKGNYFIYDDEYLVFYNIEGISKSEHFSKEYSFCEPIYQNEHEYISSYHQVYDINEYFTSEKENDLSFESLGISCD